MAMHKDQERKRRGVAFLDDIVREQFEADEKRPQEERGRSTESPGKYGQSRGK
jgi:hypothetical protein